MSAECQSVQSLPSSVGDDFVLLALLSGCRPLPCTPEPTSLAHPGRRQAPRKLGEGVFLPPDPDRRRPSPGRISHPPLRVSSVMFTRNGETANCPAVGTGTELPPAPTTSSLRVPSQALTSPDLSLPCGGARTQGPKSCLPTTASPIPISHWLKLSDFSLGPR